MKLITVIAAIIPPLLGFSAQGGIQQCTGEVCDATSVYAPPPAAWSITPVDTDGKGQNPEHPCTPCKWCKSRISWSYSGSGAYIVTWDDLAGETQGTSGEGAATGLLSIYANCGETNEAWFYADPPDGPAYEFTVTLTCVCN